MLLLGTNIVLEHEIGVYQNYYRTTEELLDSMNNGYNWDKFEKEVNNLLLE